MKRSKTLGFILMSVLFVGKLLAAEIKTVRTVEPFNRHVPWEIDFHEKDSVEVKLKETFGFVYADVMLNGQGPFRFLIDTGADASIISYELVKKLKLTPIESRDRVFETSHKKATINTALYLINEISLGTATLRHVPFIATNTASDDFQLLQSLEIEGIIGTNIFHDVILTLDLPKSRLVLNTHESFKEAKKGIHEINNQHYLPVVKTKVMRKEKASEYQFLVDSGYSGYVKMPICFNYSDRKNKESIITYDVFNQAESGFLAELDGDFMIGDKKIESPIVRYAIGDCEMPQRWGLIGTRFLKYQAVSVDQKNRRVIFH
jgi:predicted aspartyl protease